MRRTSLLLVPTLLLATVGGGLAWLSSSEAGLQTVARFAESSAAGRLHIEGASGTLRGPLAIQSLRWESPELQIKAGHLRLDWSPGALLDGVLQIAELQIDTLQVTSPPSSTPPSLPADLKLPFAVNAKKLAISEFAYGNVLSARQLSAGFASDGEQHRLSDFSVRLAETTLQGEATLQGSAPFPLTARAALSSRLEDHPLALSLNAAGPLERIALDAEATEGLEGSGTIILTPFAQAAFVSARIDLDHIDPAAWQDGAPTARLSLHTDLGPEDEGIAGSFTLTNHQPGPLDRDRLPLATLSGKLAWQQEAAHLKELKLAIAGGGELAGSGRWQNDVLNLDLFASRLDAARIVSTLRNTRLNGPVSAQLASNRQAVKLKLADSRYTLLGEASHADEQITIPTLELSADNARLSARGQLSLAGGMAFSAAGDLQRFDPSRFAKLPAARISAHFKAQGKLEPRPVVDANFELKDSLLAGQPLGGRGQLRIDWPRVPQADIQLVAGPNKLGVRGAFGRPGDTLAIAVDAPQLGAYGLEGGASGHLDLAGSLERPVLTAQLTAGKLGREGLGRINGLVLKAAIGDQPASPLHVDIALERLDLPDRPAAAKALKLTAVGSNQAHRLNGSVELMEHSRFVFAAEGGLSASPNGTSWRGQLLEALFKGDDPAQTVRLAAPTPLLLGAAAWSFGPARLAGESLDWQATLAAAADHKALKASLDARGRRLGKVEAALEAAMQGAWSLDAHSPWRGKLSSDITDLAWLGESFGDTWKTAGHFNGELQIAGTPDQPVASGSFRGVNLALHLTDQALQLSNGALAVDLENNLLRIRKLSFDSLLQTPPRALKLGAREDISGLTAKPGRLEISGEMRVDRHTGADNAFLDYQLDRVGIWQLPEQWIAVSGNGRLSWQGNTLGALGKLAVDAGYWQLAKGEGPRLSDDVVVKRAGDTKKSTALRPRLELDISTDLGRNFLFSGAGLSSRLVGDVRLRASGRDLPRASGSIRTRDGRFDAYGQQLAIERGILTFQGLLDNPALDVRAVRKGLSVEAGVQISGTAQKPTIRLTSDPELPDAEKLAWLVLGHGPDQMGAGDATLLLSAAGGLLGNDSGNLVRTLKNTFGFDEFGVRQGDIGGTGSRQPSSRVAGSSVDTTAATGNQILSIGKRLSSNAMLSYEQSLGKAEGIVKLTVALNRQISLIGRAGSDNALDIFYTLTFGKPERKPR